jgi:Zn-finger protein
VDKMHELAKEIIEKRIDKLIEENSFEKRKISNPDECVCYQQDKPCHNIENLNCLFCFCPNYDLNVEEGNCKINSPIGKYIETRNGKIWDCGDCDFPHKKENVKSIFLKVYIKD